MQCPEVEGSDKLVGQMLEVEVASLQVRVFLGGDFLEQRGLVVLSLMYA